MLFSSGGRGELRSLACRYHKTFRGTLNVQLLRGHNLKVKDNFFNMLGGKDSRPTTYAILQVFRARFARCLVVADVEACP